MKTLPTEFTESGWKFTQVSRTGDVAIYRKDRIGGNAFSFETIIVQSHNGFEVKGKNIPPSEFYPSSAQWGSLAWSFTALASAERKRDILLMAEQNA